MRALFFGFQCILVLFLTYASFVSVYISLFKSRSYDFLSLLFTFTLFALTVLSIQKLYSKKPFSDIQISLRSKALWGPILIGFISLMIGFFNISSQYSRGTFFDEIKQFEKSFKRSSPVSASANQQQPPLDYYFSSFSQSLFGVSKFAVRSHAMFFYLILSLILPLGLWFFYPSLLGVFAGTVLFLINHIVRLHAVNGRPLCLALFTGFLFLFFYLSYCKNKGSDKDSLFWVLVSQYLFIMSIGLQPVILIVSLFISSLWLLVTKQKNLFKSLFLSHLAIAFLALPFYLNMYGIAKGYSKFKQPSLELTLNYVSNLDIFYFIGEYFSPFYEQMKLFFVILISGFVVTSFIKRSVSQLTVITGCSLLMFPLLFDVLFSNFIKWPKNEWYFIVFTLFLIFLWF